MLPGETTCEAERAFALGYEPARVGKCMFFNTIALALKKPSRDLVLNSCSIHEEQSGCAICSVKRDENPLLQWPAG